jgi:large subunit ribosomal protein L6
VEVSIDGRSVAVKGPKGELSHTLADPITIEQADGELQLARPTDRGPHRALHGLSRALLANMVEGVSAGFEKRLEIQGVGYRAQLKGTGIELSVGYSHPVQIEAPDGITFQVPEPTEIIVSGIDKQAVGQVAAEIRAVRPPEPYKGKGIRYLGETVRRKVGKRA